MNLDNLAQEFKDLEILVYQKTFIKRTYPSLTRFMFTYLGKQEKIVQYAMWCKQFKDDPYNYFLYVHGYFFTMLEQERAEGKLTKGKW